MDSVKTYILAELWRVCTNTIRGWFEVVLRNVGGTKWNVDIILGLYFVRWTMTELTSCVEQIASARSLLHQVVVEVVLCEELSDEWFACPFTFFYSR